MVVAVVVEVVVAAAGVAGAAVKAAGVAASIAVGSEPEPDIVPAWTAGDYTAIGQTALLVLVANGQADEAAGRPESAHSEGLKGSHQCDLKARAYCVAARILATLAAYLE